MIATSPVGLAAFLRDTYAPIKLDLSESRVRQIGGTIRRLEEWAGRPMSLADLSEDLIRRFLLFSLAGHSPATVNTRRADMLALWRVAADEGLVGCYPEARRIRRAKTPQGLPEAWTAAEVCRVLLAAAQEPGAVCGLPAALWWRSLLLTFYDTGERRAAVFATSSADLDPVSRWVIFRHTKTGVTRACQLHPETAAACARIHDAGRPLVWPRDVSMEAIEDRFRVILRRAGVKHGGHTGLFHRFRRTCGTLTEAGGGRGDLAIGNTRAVFLRHYFDPRHGGQGQLPFLPRP